MTTRCTCTGIDEAGFGPVLGPLAIVAVSAEAADGDTLIAAFGRSPLGVRDSKRLHRSGDLAPLESVALGAIAWLTGRQPRTAAECFTLLDEHADDRAEWPWMAGAEDLILPCAATSIPSWRLEGVDPIGFSGVLAHPHHLNRDRADGINRAQAELRRVQALLGRLPPAPSCDTRVDRLGGRRYYADALAEVWPQHRVAVEAEEAACSRYLVAGSDGSSHRLRFEVDGESAWPLTAIASCIAKYARELHMRLLNRYWGGRLRTLRPTAGYPQDARRWMHQLGDGYLGAWGHGLVRDWAGNA